MTGSAISVGDVRVVPDVAALIRATLALSSVSLTCFGGVSSDLPFKALQILKHHGIVADKYVLSPHSVNLIVPAESREAAVKALHSLI